MRVLRIDGDVYTPTEGSANVVRPLFDEPDYGIPQEYGIAVYVKDDEAEADYEIILNDRDIEALFGGYLRMVTRAAYRLEWEYRDGDSAQTEGPYGSDFSFDLFGNKNPFAGSDGDPDVYPEQFADSDDYPQPIPDCCQVHRDLAAAQAEDPQCSKCECCLCYLCGKE